jgi:trigger factor
MQVKSERLEECQVRLTIELDGAEVENKLRKTAQDVARRYAVPGYRKGKAPYAAVLRAFGRELLQQQALEDSVEEMVGEAMKESGLEPYDVGKVDKVEWDPFVLEMIVPIRPEVDLGDYRAVRLDPELKPVGDEDVERYLEDLRQEHAQWVPVERPAAMGDRVVVDIDGRIGDRVVLGNQGRELILTDGARYPLPGFHEQVAGMSADEEKRFVLTYPDDDPRQDVAGREATFTVKLVTAGQQDIPPLDDDLAAMVGDYASLADLRTAAHRNLEVEAQQAAEAEFADRVLAAMVEQAPKIEFPSQAVDRELDSMLEDMESNLAARGLKMEAYLGILRKTRAAYRQDLRPAATDRVKRLLALSEIVKREGLQVEDAEVDAELAQLKAREESQDAKLQEALDSPVGRVGVMNDLLIAAARQRIVDIAKGEAPALVVRSETASVAETAVVAEQPPVVQSETASVAEEPPVVESETASVAEPEPAGENPENPGEGSEPRAIGQD